MCVASGKMLSRLKANFLKERTRKKTTDFIPKMKTSDGQKNREETGEKHRKQLHWTLFDLNSLDNFKPIKRVFILQHRTQYIQYIHTGLDIVISA